MILWTGERNVQRFAVNDKDVRVREIDRRKARHAGHELHRLAHRCRVERIVRNDSHTHAGRKPLDHGSQRPACFSSGEERPSVRRPLQWLKLRHEELLRLFPRDRLVLSGAARA